MRQRTSRTRLTAIALAAGVVLFGLAAARGSEEPFEGAADSPFDGVWVGILDATANGTTRPYPVLANLDVRDASGHGVLLLPDTLTGAPDALQYRSLDLQAKGKKLTARAAAGGAARAGEFDVTLRLKRGALKGSLNSDEPGFSRGRIELRPLDAEQPLQQLWVGRLAEARGAGRLAALAFWTGSAVSGAGFVGDAFGQLIGAQLAAGRLTGQLATTSGDLDVDVNVGNKGLLQGTLDGLPLGSRGLAPGGLAATPSLRKLKPSSLPSGVSTEVAIRGKNLAPGFLLHADVPGIYVGVPAVSSARKATVMVTVAAGVAADTSVQLQVSAANGQRLTGKPRLTTGAVAAVSFTGDLLPILTGTCAVEGCHAQPDLNDPAYPDGEAAGGLVMESSQAYANLVGTPSTERPELNRIEPFDPERSYLIKKIRGDADIEGDRMPQGGPFLAPEVVDMFIRWVQAGAARN